ncbi:hypothetical protein [Caenimonas aquaedulcis]|uniref:Uncharacterized protein n=1 Tax=Caenimonas aquaedulcis TaxID=2793270 RepID=A0A931H626_9BURK|nr:hypothetical protein [Caenimonas aquaedulcis]MBG9389320.1 hypothetical protein [Caenimonas aquaedulcis]
MRQLEDELFMARQSIVSLAPDEFHDLLSSHYSCETRSESYQWANEVAEEVIDKAIPIDEDRGWGQRAYCPLCRAGAQSFYSSERGYSLPEGLRRHLVGFGRTRECSVMEAARKMAQGSWNRKFGPKEDEARELEVKQKAQRLKTEVSYVIGPTDDAALLEGDWWAPARTTGDEEFSIKWAEQRLFSLGFRINVDGLRRSYLHTGKSGDAEFIIYADPRRKGRISMRVFYAAAKGRKKGIPLHSFDIRDAWKNNLPEKVAAGIEAAAKSPRR